MVERSQKLDTSQLKRQVKAREETEAKQKAQRDKQIKEKRLNRYNAIEQEKAAENDHINNQMDLISEHPYQEKTKNDSELIIQKLAAIGWSMDQIQDFQMDRMQFEDVLTDQELLNCLDIFISEQLSFTLWRHIVSNSLNKNPGSFLHELKTVLKQIKNLLPKFAALYENGWSIKEIQDLIATNMPAFSKTQHSHISDFIEVIRNFRLKSPDCKDMKQVSNSDELLLAIRDIAFKKTFEDNVQDMNFTELLQELEKKNPSNSINFGFIKEKFLDVEKRFVQDSNLLRQGIPINQWGKTNILNWGKHLKQSTALARKESNLAEILAVIKQAVILDSKYSPRIIQMLSILILISKDNRGILAQIYTGEGKSMTISILAILKTLQGHTVDIVTSSEPLAIRDSESKQSLYSMFGLNTAHNVLMDGMGKPKECYLQDIVYGTTHRFQVDILFDEYKLRGTLNKRKSDLIIVDEVDSMLIDQHNYSTLLAVPCPGMDELTPILTVMWMTLTQHASLLTPEEKFAFPLEEGKILETPAQYYLAQTAKDFIDSHVKDESIIPLSSTLKKYAMEHIPKWAQSALTALKYYQEDKHYLIKNHEIVPIDFENTGALQENTHWQEGLHQFLQLKHGLPPSRLGLTTNYLSNVGFFRRYGQNLYGLTGTLGSESCQKLLKDVYKVELAFIPPYKRRQLFELPAIITHSPKDWLDEICRTVIKELKYGRAVLVISNTIADTNRVEKMLNSTKQKFSVRKYIRNDENQEKIIEEEVRPQDVILATNLAGRGTDIRTSSEVEKNGGMHVCVTYLPSNLRVELQAFGRTGRNGKKGTAQLVLEQNENFERLQINSDLRLIESLTGSGRMKEIQFDERKLKERRDNLEIERNEYAYKKIEEIDLNDQLFTKYCQFIGSIPKLRAEVHKCDAIEERWGLWLGGLNRNESKDRINNSFDQFCNDVRISLQNNDGILNHKYHVREGLQLALEGQNERALDILNQAVSMGPNDFKARHQLGCVQAALNQPDAAEQSFRKQIELIDFEYQRVQGLKNLVDQAERSSPAVVLSDNNVRNGDGRLLDGLNRRNANSDMDEELKEASEINIPQVVGERDINARNGASRFLDGLNRRNANSNRDQELKEASEINIPQVVGERDINARNGAGRFLDGLNRRNANSNMDEELKEASEINIPQVVGEREINARNGASRFLDGLNRRKANSNRDQELKEASEINIPQVVGERDINARNGAGRFLDGLNRRNANSNRDQELKEASEINIPQVVGERDINARNGAGRFLDGLNRRKANSNRDQELKEASEINIPQVVGERDNKRFSRLSADTLSDSNSLHQNQSNLQAIKSNLQAELDTLKTLRGHAEENVKKIQAARGNNEDIDIEYEPVTNVVNNLKEKQKENLLADGLPKIGSVRTKEKKKKKKNWWGIIGCALLGVAQVVIGSMMSTASGFLLSELGYGLIAEGVNDIIHAGICAFTDKEFSWKEYGTNKLVSVGVTIALAGYSAYSKLKSLGPNSGHNLLDGFPESWNKFKKAPLSVIKDGLAKGILEKNSWKYFPAGFAKNLSLNKSEVANDIITKVQHQIQENGTFNALKEGKKLEEKMDDLQSKMEEILGAIVTECLRSDKNFNKLVHLDLYSSESLAEMLQKQLPEHVQDFILNNQLANGFFEKIDHKFSGQFSGKHADLSEKLNIVKGVIESCKSEIQFLVKGAFTHDECQKLIGNSQFEKLFISEFTKQVNKKLDERVKRLETLIQQRQFIPQNEINSLKQEDASDKKALVRELMQNIELMHPQKAGVFNSLQTTRRQIDHFFNKYPNMTSCKEAVLATFSELESRLNEKRGGVENKLLKSLVEAFTESLSKRIMTILKSHLAKTIEKRLKGGP